MSTRASASAVFPLAIDKVWSALRDFTFPATLAPSVIQSCKIISGSSPFELGAVREVVWKSGEKKKQRLIELSDQFRRITWETIESDPISETTAAITGVRLTRVTDSSATLVEWASDFSSDVSGKLITFETKAYQDTLREMLSVLVAASGPKPKLYYFPVSGRGEFIRLILEDRNSPYEFVAVPFGEQAKEPLASKLPYGQLPMWEEGDFRLAQTSAIASHAAKRVGLYPASLNDQATAEMLFQASMDVLGKYFGVVVYKTVSKEDFLGKFIPSWLSSFEKQLKRVNDGKGYFLSEFSYADLAVFQVLDLIHHLDNGAFKATPALQAFHARVAARPNVAAYLNSARRAK